MYLRREVYYEIWPEGKTESTWKCTEAEAMKIAGWLDEAGIGCSVQEIVVETKNKRIATFTGLKKAS